MGKYLYNRHKRISRRSTPVENTMFIYSRDTHALTFLNERNYVRISRFRGNSIILK